MKTVSVAELEQDVHAVLESVRQGEEIQVEEGGGVVARIVPTAAADRDGVWPNEAELVRTGKLRLPLREMDWDEFFRMPRASVGDADAIQALIDSRGDR